MSSQIEDKVSKCSTCSQFQRAQPKEPMVIQGLPERSWAKIGSDLFEFNGAHYLLSVDYYSKWIEIAKLSNLNSNNVICHLKSQFAKYGIPDELISDNGPQYSSLVFKEFSHNYGFVHRTSSPKYPQANGEAERAVQTIESLLKKAQDPYKALLNYRNTPLEGIGLSPAELLMGRRLKKSLPTHADLLKRLGAKEVKEHFEKRKLKEKVYYDKHSGKELPSLNNGEKVTLQHGNKWVPATVISKHHTPRSYIVQTPEGQKYRRNRRHLNKCRVSQDILTASAHDQPKASPNTPTAKVSTVPVPTTEAPPPVCTRSGRLVKVPAYLKDYEH